MSRGVWTVLLTLGLTTGALAGPPCVRGFDLYPTQQRNDFCHFGRTFPPLFGAAPILGGSSSFCNFPFQGYYGYSSSYYYTDYYFPPTYVIVQPINYGAQVFDPPAPFVNNFRPVQPIERAAAQAPLLGGVPVGNIPDPKPAPRPVARPKDELEQRADALNLIRAGNEAFADGQYAAAARKYSEAVAAAPQDPLAFFHLAQAQLALGKFAEAGMAIQRGLKLHPNWPQAGFQPKALYGDRQGEYQQHVARLADLLGKNLNDDALYFLLGYQLWFDGRRDEAIILLQRANALAIDTGHIERFLKAKADGMPVAKP